MYVIKLINILILSIMKFFINLIRTFRINQIKNQKRNNEIRQFILREEMRENLLQNRISLTYMRNNLKKY